MHHSYHIVGMTDLDVIRTQARRRYHDDRWPEDTTIHFHEHGIKCENKNHEYVNDETMVAELEVMSEQAAIKVSNKLEVVVKDEEE